jgi:hypothetical protein
MKPLTVSLAASTVALAIVTIYLGRELAAARAAADEAGRSESRLAARVTELQHARGTNPGFKPFSPVGRAPASAGTRTEAAGAAASTEERSPVERAEMEAAMRANFAKNMQSPVVQRALRGQLRVGAKRMYSDFAAESGLTPGQATALYELIAEQQSDPGATAAVADGASPDAAQRQREQELDAKFTALLGDSGVARLRKYQSEFGVRAEVMQLDEQLAGLDVPLTAEQKRRLVRATQQDAEQFPMPEYGSNQTPEQVARAHEQWQRERGERIAATVRAVLTPAQMQHYDDLREMQRAFEDGGPN